jgi:hypothetical protein
VVLGPRELGQARPVGSLLTGPEQVGSVVGWAIEAAFGLWRRR